MHETNAILRAAALLAAVLRDPEDDAVLPTAQAYHHWLTGPHPATTAILVAGTPVSRNQQKGTTVSIVIPDDDQITLTMTGFDDQKVPVADPFTDPAGIYLAPFTYTADNTALAELTVAPDTLSVVLKSAPGVVGIVNVTPTDVNGKSAPPITVEIDPTAAVSAGFVAGTPVPRTDTPAG